MKTIYQKPNTKIVLLQHQAHILAESLTIKALNTNLGDDAILEATARLLWRHLPEAEVAWKRSPL